ncbi:hypothetical protein BHE74_00027973 [Ensete ventricosum]|nr:hypothetical protein BHE74_00027973 [Ensete ventricosum]
MIRAVIVMNTEGKPRLLNFYEFQVPEIPSFLSLICLDVCISNWNRLFRVTALACSSLEAQYPEKPQELTRSVFTDVDLTVTSSCPRTTGPLTWMTRRGKSVWRRYEGVSGRTTDLTQVRSTPLTWRRTSHRKDGGHGGEVRRHAADLRGRTWGTHPSGRAPTLFRDDRGRASAQGLEPAVLTQRIRGQTESTRQAPDLTVTFLALEGGPMSQERPFGNSGAEHHLEPNHPQPIEEATVAMPTPNRFWRMMTDLGFPSPASNPAPFVVTTKAFLGLTSQVQALAGMVQTIVLHLPQLVHSTAHQSVHPAAPPQTESPTAPNRVAPPEKEVLRSRVEVGESSKGGSPFTPEIQAKPLPATFKLSALEPYEGTSDPTEHIAAFRAQMALYDTSDALMWNSRPPSVPSHPSVIDGAETVEVLLVVDRATACDPARDAATGASVRGSRDAGSGQAGRDKVPPGGAVPWTSRATAKEEGRQVGHVASQTPPIPLNSTRTEIFFQIRERGLLKAPNPMKSHPERRDKRRYCRFHREYGHDTEECHDLQYQIEDFIRRGHLHRYVREQSSLPDGRPPRDSSPRPKGPVEKQIDIIFGGPASGGNSSSTRKAYARSEVGKRPLHDEDLDAVLLNSNDVVQEAEDSASRYGASRPRG